MGSTPMATAGAIAGLGAGILALGVCVAANPWFADAPALAAALFGLLPAAGGAVLFGAAGLVARRGPAAGPRRGRGPAALAILTIALVGLAVSGTLVPRPPLHTKMLVYGVDAANLALMEPMMKAGELPNFSRLAGEGAHGTLKSMEPVISPVVWTNIATGHPREQHGISGFKTRSDECLKPRIWDYFAEKGQVVGTYKWLVTWPPQEVTGFQVPGWLAQGAETVPEDLGFVKEFELGNRQSHDRKGRDASGLGAQLAFVREGIRHGLRLSTLASAVGFIVKAKVAPVTPDEGFYRMNVIRSNIDRDVFHGLLDRFDPALATFTYYPTDNVAHRFWKYFEPEGFTDVTPEQVERYRDVVPETYRQADQILGELLARMPSDAHVVVVSDHGMTSANDGGGYFAFGLTTGGVQRFLTGRGAKVDVSNVGQKVSVGIAKDSRLDAAAVEAAIAELTFRGQPLVKVDVIDPGGPGTPPLLGFSLAVLDDLRGDIESGSRIQVSGQDGPPLSEMVATVDAQSGVHTLDGVVIARGPKVTPLSGRMGDTTILDVAPTVIALAGLAPACDMPGKVMPFFLGAPPPCDPHAEAVALVNRQWRQVGRDAAGQAAVDDMLIKLGYKTEGTTGAGSGAEPAGDTAAAPTP